MTEPKPIPVDQEQVSTPNNFIIWLDQHIGKSEECILLKSTLFMTMNPTSDLYEQLNKDDINKSISAGVALLVRLDLVEFMFQAFDDVEKCFLTIEKNLTKRIFFITSGSKGRIIIPGLMANFPTTFVPDYRMYIFCLKMNMVTTDFAGEPTNDWADKYEDNVVMFNHQDDLLTRLVLDIATYFSTEGERYEKAQELENALQYYEWSKLMWERYDTMQKPNPMKKKINQMAQRITQIEQKIGERKKAEDVTAAQPSDEK